jgi:hypothetical protein
MSSEHDRPPLSDWDLCPADETLPHFRLPEDELEPVEVNDIPVVYIALALRIGASVEQ